MARGLTAGPVRRPGGVVRQRRAADRGGLPAEAVREFWTYVDKLGPRELPAFVWPRGDELAMQAFVLGAETNLDPEEGDESLTRRSQAASRASEGRASPWPRRRRWRCGGRPCRRRCAGRRPRRRAPRPGVPDGADEQLALDLPVRDGRPGGQARGQLLGGRQHRLVVVDQPGEQPEPACASSAATGSASISSSVALAWPTRRGRVQDAPVSPARPDVGERHQERRARAADAEVGQERQRRAGAGRHAPHGGDHRLGQRGERRGPAGCSAPRPCSAARRRDVQRGDVLLEVLADAEGPAGAGEHDRAARPGRSRPRRRPRAARPSAPRRASSASPGG